MHWAWRQLQTAELYSDHTDPEMISHPKLQAARLLQRLLCALGTLPPIKLATALMQCAVCLPENHTIQPCAKRPCCSSSAFIAMHEPGMSNSCQTLRRRVVESDLELYTCRQGVPQADLPAHVGNGTIPTSYNELATLLTVTGVLPPLSLCQHSQADCVCKVVTYRARQICPMTCDSISCPHFESLEILLTKCSDQVLHVSVSQARRPFGICSREGRTESLAMPPS